VSLRFSGIPVWAGICMFASAIPAADLTLGEAVTRAVAGHPALLAQQSSLAATESQASLDGLAPPVTVGTELENFAGTGDLAGLDQVETTLRIGRTFELGGKREARKALGEARIVGQRGQIEGLRLDVAADAARRFYDVLAQQSRLELSRAELELARQTHEAVAHRVRRGVSPEADLTFAELSVARAELELEDVEHELDAARVALSVLWGQREPEFDRVTGSVASLPEPPSFASLSARIPNSVDARRLTEEEAALDAAGRVARASAAPDLHGTLGVRRLEALDDQALVLSLSVPIGLRARSDLSVARNRAELDSLRERRRAYELDAYARLYARYEELRHTRARHAALVDRMVPAAERALALARRGYEEARYSFLSVAQAQDVLQDLHGERITAAIDYYRLLTDLERATAISGAVQ
jgi:cobalt-zinc-cadmium efflux system outer membrane protein